MNWPWPFSLFQQEPVIEKRHSFPDLISDYALAVASGEVSDTSGTSSIETCCGLYARGFMLATVKPQTSRTMGLTPELLGYLGRQIMRHGEALCALEVIDGELVYLPCTLVNIDGDLTPDSYRYRVSFSTPDSVIHRTYDGSRIIHLKYGTSASLPYRGLSPLKLASLSSSFHTSLESRLKEEATATSGYVIPVPVARKDKSAAGDDPLDKIEKQLRGVAGKTRIVQSMMTGWGEGKAAKVPAEWMQKRLGFDPPDHVAKFREQVHQHILASYGISEGLFRSSGSGQSIRELWRVFCFSSLTPVGMMAANVIGKAIGEPSLELSFEKTYAADVLSRATAFARLVKDEKMDTDRAIALTGLMDLEVTA